MRKVVQRSSGLLACVGLALLTLAVLSYPTQFASGASATDVVICDEASSGLTVSAACAGTWCPFTPPNCGGYCVLLPLCNPVYLGPNIISCYCSL